MTNKLNPAPEHGRVAIAAPVVKRLLKEARTIAALSSAASAELGWMCDERTVRLAIDRLRRGTKTEAQVPINRVAPNTFKIEARRAV